MAAVLEINDLHKRYGAVDALRGVNLVLPGPGICGFLGPNGAGKTTTIKLIAGLLRVSAGRIRIDGIDIQEEPVEAKRRIGVMMETPAFYGFLSGRDNLRALGQLSGRNDAARIEILLDQVGLSAKANARASSYSRGMRQRLGLAAALLDDPQLVILDEPTNGLDPAGIVEMRQWLAVLAHNEKRTILLSSHQIGEMERVCDSYAIIKEGSIVAFGSAADLGSDSPSILVRVSDARTAVTALREMTAVTHVEMLDSNRVRIDSGDVPAWEINRFLLNRGIDVIEITEKTESLEDIFFRLVGRSHHVA